MPRAGLQAGTLQGHARGCCRGFPGRPERGQQAGPDAERHAFPEHDRGQREFTYRQDKVQIGDGPGHKLYQAVAEQNPQTNTGNGPHSTHEHGFTQHQEANLTAGHTLGAQQAKQAPSLNDREGHGVVNEKGPDDQRQQAQGRQVELEGARHLLNGLRAAA